MAVWIEKYIKPNQYSRPQERLTAVRKLVVHYTANPGATAMGHYNYFNNLTDRYASAHMFVDKTEAINIIPLSEIAYHANDIQKRNADGSAWRGVKELLPNANFLSIGVELCIEKDASFHPDTITRAVDVFAELCKKFNLDPIDDIVRHFDVTSKNCPAPFVSNPKAFTDFKNRVNAKVKGATTSQPAPKPSNAPAQATGTLPQGAVGVATITADVLNIRDTYSLDSNVIGQVTKGQKYPVFKIVNEFYLIATGMWISNNGGKYATYEETPKEPEHLYRVRKSADDASSQIGAYANLDSAKDLADKNDGYEVYDETGKVVYTPKKNKPATHMYRVRKTWTDAGSQIGAFSELENAKDLADKNAGFEVYDEDGKVVYAPPVKAEEKPPVVETKPATPTTPPVPPVAPKPPVVEEKPPVEPEKPQEPVVDHTGHNNILGKSVVNADKMVAFVKSVNPNAQDIEEIAKQFIEVGDKYGIRGDVAFCQSIIETGYFKFDGGTAVTPDQHNYCGHGVTSKGMKGSSFITVKDGVTAQLQHLFAYATINELPSGEEIVDSRFKYVTKGIAPHWEDLNNRWAMNTHYGQDILALYNKLVAFVPPVVVEESVQEPVVPPVVEPIVPPVVEEPTTEPTQEIPVEVPKEDDAKVSMIKKLIDYFIEKLAQLFGKK